MRADKYVSSQRTDLSRSDVKKLIRAGRVTCEGRKVSSPEEKIPDGAEVCVDGVPIVYREHVYIMLNKPQGYVCSTREGASPTVLELVPPELRRRGLFPAGRLDKDTEGFVLITDDGALAHDMLAPGKHVPKKYFVRLEKEYNENDEKCLPAEAGPDPGDPFACTLILHEGKFHQVKRMFEAVGNRVIFLRRISIGNLGLDPNLGLGECLEIMHKDVEKLLCR